MGHMGQPQDKKIFDSIVCSSNAYYRPSINFSLLKSEEERLKTFSCPESPWPISFISPSSCASAGFFYLKENDKVQCAFCKGVAGEWEEGDVPLNEHKKHFPRCPFVLKLPCGNRALSTESESSASSGSSSSDESMQSDEGFDVCGPYESMTSTSSSPTVFEQIQLKGALPISDEEDRNNVVANLAIRTRSGPARKHLVTKESRLKTFTHWPTDSGQTPDAMAEAGFLSIGMRDYVKCFYCDGGLRNWEANDDPWFEHARWFPTCTYVLLNKGQAYIQNATSTTTAKKTGRKNNLKPRNVTEAELCKLIDTPVVKAALEIGIELNKVKSALRERMLRTGTPFPSTQSLLESIFESHGEEGDRDGEYESDESEGEDEVITISSSSIVPTPSYRAGGIMSGNSTSSSTSSSTSEEDHELFGSSSSSSSSSSSPESSQESMSSASSSSEVSSGEEEGMDIGPVTTTSTSSNTNVTTSSSTTNISSSNTTIISNKTSATRTNSEDSGICGSGGVLERSVSNSSSSSSGCGSGDEEMKECLSSSTEGKVSLEEELRKLKEARQCKICMDNEVGVVFLPCGHLVSCVRCATALSTCALCRQPIQALVKTYLS